MKKVITFIFIVSLMFSLQPQLANAAVLVKNSQDVTAYTGSKYTINGAVRKTANGYAPKGGDVAIRKSANIPFGTVVIIPSPITTGDGQYRNSFTVQDWGVSSSLSTHAIDIWWGFCRTNAYTGTGATILGCSQNDAKFQSARNFGKKSMKLTFHIKN